MCGQLRDLNDQNSRLELDKSFKRKPLYVGKKTRKGKRLLTLFSKFNVVIPELIVVDLTTIPCSKS